MPTQSKMIARSPSPPEPDDSEEVWPVYGIVGEDVDVFGNSSYEVRWRDWSRPDGTNTTWMRATDTDSFLVESWESAMKQQRLRKATESQSIDLTLLASTPMHDRLTFERSEAVDEKIEERLRKDGPVNLYQGWMEEIEEKVAQHKGGRGDKSPTKSKKVIKIPHVTRSNTREGSHAESSRSATAREQRALRIQDTDHARLPFFGGDDHNQ